MGEDFNKERSVFNEGKLNLLRLHNSWVKCAHYRTNAMYDNWKFELDTVWTELCQDVIKNRIKNFSTKEKLNNLLRVKVGIAKNRQQLYEALHDRHIFLRRLQDAAGKGGSYTGDAGDDFD